MNHLRKFNEKLTYVPKGVVDGGNRYKGRPDEPSEWVKSQDGFHDHGFVINGNWFPFGAVQDHVFIGKPGDSNKMIIEIIDSANRKFKDDLIFPICHLWIYNTWMKYSGPATPSHWFQAPLYTKEKAIDISEYLIQKFDETGYTQSIIAIAEGWICVRKKDPYNCFGDAYTKSGRFIDNPNLMSRYNWNKDNKIFFVE